MDPSLGSIPGGIPCIPSQPSDIKIMSCPVVVRICGSLPFVGDDGAEDLRGRAEAEVCRVRGIPLGPWDFQVFLYVPLCSFPFAFRISSFLGSCILNFIFFPFLSISFHFFPFLSISFHFFPFLSICSFAPIRPLSKYPRLLLLTAYSSSFPFSWWRQGPTAKS